jgi:PAS domain S-box-containing protein
VTLPPEVSPDEGGEAPCFSALTDRTLDAGDGLLAWLVRNLADAVVVADAEGLIVFWNDAAGRLLGWSAEEAVGQTLDLIVPERFRRRHWSGYSRTMKTGQTEYAERLLTVPALRRDGSTVSIAFTVTLLPGDDAMGPRGVAAVIRDDTERWELQRAAGG